MTVPEGLGGEGEMMRQVALAWVAGSISFYTAAPADAGELLRVQGHLMRWTPQPAGGKTIVTYSILQAPYQVESGKNILSPSNCAQMHAFADIVTKSPGITEEKAKSELQAAFRTWEQAADIAFIEAADPGKANIVIGAADDPGGRAFANLSYRSEKGLTPVTMALGKPDNSTSRASDEKGADGSIVPIDQAYVCLNPKSRWKTGFDGDLDVYDLRHTFTHEVGHAIGLDHPDSTGAVMAFRYDEGVRELQSSDIAGVRRLYGPHTAE